MTITVKLRSKTDIERREDGSRFGTIEYFVRSDDADQDIDDILDDVGIPDQHVTTHPDNVKLICRRLKCDRFSDSQFLYIVTADFDSRLDVDRPEHNAEQSIVEGGIRGFTEMVPAFYDGTGAALVNSAGDYFEGATRKKRLLSIPVTAYFTVIPWALFTKLSNTVNASAVTIHGGTFPAGVCLLGDPQMASKPVDAETDSYWQVDYEIIIDPDGHEVEFPDRGYQSKQYQTREESDPVTDPRTFLDWENVDYADYAAESDSEQKRYLKIPNTDDTDADSPEQTWLDNYGQAVTASLTYETGTASTTAGSTAVSSVVFSPALDPDTDTGKRIEIVGAGLNGRKLVARIAAIASGGGSLTLSSPAHTAVAANAVRIGGVWTKRYLMEELADWTGLPLPNNHTS